MRNAREFVLYAIFSLYIMYFKNVENVQDITYIQINEKKLKWNQ